MGCAAVVVLVVVVANDTIVVIVCVKMVSYTTQLCLPTMLRLDA